MLEALLRFLWLRSELRALNKCLNSAKVSVNSSRSILPVQLSQVPQIVTDRCLPRARPSLFVSTFAKSSAASYPQRCKLMCFSVFKHHSKDLTVQMKKSQQVVKFLRISKCESGRHTALFTFCGCFQISSQSH